MEVLKVNFPGNARVSSIEISMYGQDELRNHGAPNQITVRQGTLGDKAFWECMKKTQDALNATPDHYPLRAPEIRTNSIGSFHASHNGNHNISGGDRYAVFDSIRREDSIHVFLKSMRELRALNLITNEDYTGGLRQILEHDMRHKTAMDFHAHKDFQPGSQDIATHTVHGYGLSADIEALLAVSKPGTPAFNPMSCRA